MRLLWAIDHGMQATSKRMEATLGMTFPQRLVLRIVGRYPQISAGELAKIMHVHPSTITGILRRLEQRGVVGRVPDPTDARRALLTLSEAGKELDVRTPGTVEAAVSKLLDEVPPKKLRAASDVLRALAARLELAEAAEAPKKS